MEAAYDIFRAFPDSGPIWIEVVHGLENARFRLLELRQSRPGDYFVFDSANAKVVATTAESVKVPTPAILQVRPSQRPRFSL